MESWKQWPKAINKPSQDQPPSKTPKNHEVLSRESLASKLNMGDIMRSSSSWMGLSWFMTYVTYHSPQRTLVGYFWTIQGIQVQYKWVLRT
jgi:hypothetical protein